MSISDDASPVRIYGVLCWFSAKKGYGFIVPDDGPEVLLHVNTLRDFGLASATDGAEIEGLAREGDRGWQLVEILSLTPPKGRTPPPMKELSHLPVVPARVKWFDPVKGSGFATVFGRPEDVFIHLALLTRAGLCELIPGEAVGLRVATGPKGLVAEELVPWAAVICAIPR